MPRTGSLIVFMSSGDHLVLVFYGVALSALFANPLIRAEHSLNIIASFWKLIPQIY